MSQFLVEAGPALNGRHHPRVNGDAMEAAGLRRQYSDEMVSRLREYRAAA